MSLTAAQRAHCYQLWLQELQQNILPFWLRAMDTSYGGVFTCFRNDGATLLSDNKFTWSQGRFLWNESRQAALIQAELCQGDAAPLLEHARQTADFLLAHAVLDNGHCAFLLDRRGNKLEMIPGEGYDSSFYADCFVVAGLCEYAFVAGESRYFEQALALYDNVRQRLSSGRVRSEPYPAPPGFEPYGYEMIMLSTVSELLRYAQRHQHPALARLTAIARHSLAHVFSDFHQPQTLMPLEMKVSAELSDTLLARHKTPGHTLENMWFCLHTAQLLGETGKYLPAIEKITAMMWHMGWDKTYGGLFRYVQADGSPPSGRLLGGDPFEALIAETWSSKIWWVHSEALYTLLLMADRSDNAEFFSLYQQTADYVLETFPNREHGEWTQIRDRYGAPLNKVVALPVKDPFHIMRNLQLIIALCGQPSEQ
ncbi:hypothetical protein BTJ39_19225 [Izhakiella australiensis]|uniref:N-acylglucosamine 2-epimerase n=1 Tax=Izhakiella australiensis TaxID=1926881 RepID=A0A1S8YGU5_9GAMM|nr:AGE family epimerase/isomerase [Izhakiella australiensis]OON38097.1 hypothetical protein BTJ39_19225 [Izhakiella australiensis]